MCYELHHKCNYCNAEYDCSLSNEECPTINFDLDKNLCSYCRTITEEIIKTFNDEITFDRIKFLLRDKNEQE